MRDVPLATILDVVARRCGLDVAQARTQASDAARQARRVFCYLARGLTQASPAEIGETILEREAEVCAAAEEVGALLCEGRDFTELAVEAEVELRALVELSATRGFPLPTTASPRVTAARLVLGGRDAFTVPRVDLAALAAAYLARATEPTLAPPPLVRAAAEYENAIAAAEAARFTARERGADAALKAARARLLALMGVEAYVEA
jgi:hypothetical protein